MIRRHATVAAVVLGAAALVGVVAAVLALVVLPTSRTWIDGFPVGMREHCHDEGCRATISHAVSRLDALEPDHPEVVERRTFHSDVRNADGYRPIFRARGQQYVIALSLADGSSRLRLVSCGHVWDDDPFVCADWSLAGVEALVGDQ